MKATRRELLSVGSRAGIAAWLAKTFGGRIPNLCSKDAEIVRRLWTLLQNSGYKAQWAQEARRVFPEFIKATREGFGTMENYIAYYGYGTLDCNIDCFMDDPEYFCGLADRWLAPVLRVLIK